MKLEQRTLQVLKNYATINPSIMFKQGNVISTISPIQTVMSKATLPNQIPATFAIIDLSRFLGVLSLFESPEITLNENFLVVGDKNKQVQYTYADPKLIVAPGEKEIKLPSVDVSFQLENEDLQSVLKAMGVLGLPEIAISGEDGKINIEAINSKNPNGDKYSVQVNSPISVVDKNAKFRMIITAENLKVLPGSYTVNVSSKGLIQLKGNDIEYWIATESSSSYVV